MVAQRTQQILHSIVLQNEPNEEIHNYRNGQIKQLIEPSNHNKVRRLTSFLDSCVHRMVCTAADR